jgi:UDP-2-acetamido-2-deoxy-ribo-hexuluronate aminotransferase
MNARHPVPFLDMKALLEAQGPQLRKALLEVLESGRFIGGPKVGALEGTLARLVGVDHAVAVSSGTVAEHLLLLAEGIGPGDEVLVPDFTFAATAEAVILCGATPIFVDVEPETFSMDLDAAKAALSSRVRAVVPVSLFGHPAYLSEFESFTREHGLIMIEDTCQSLGAREAERASGSFGRAAYTSFYPAKPLGGLGDGGMIFTRDLELAERLARMRHHGEIGHHLHGEMGTNARLDALQCAALLVRAESFPEEIARRDELARRYSESLRDAVKVPRVREACSSTWAQYTLTLGGLEERERFQAHLRERGVPTVVHYPRPLHEQPSMQAHLGRTVPTPVTEDLCRRVVSLPLSAYMDPGDQDRVIEAVRSWAGLETLQAPSAVEMEGERG